MDVGGVWIPKPLLAVWSCLDHSVFLSFAASSIKCADSYICSGSWIWWWIKVSAWDDPSPGVTGFCRGPTPPSCPWLVGCEARCISGIDWGQVWSWGQWRDSTKMVQGPPGACLEQTAPCGWLWTHPFPPGLSLLYNKDLGLISGLSTLLSPKFV